MVVPYLPLSNSVLKISLTLTFQNNKEYIVDLNSKNSKASNSMARMSNLQHKYKYLGMVLDTELVAERGQQENHLMLKLNYFVSLTHLMCVFVIFIKD